MRARLGIVAPSDDMHDTQPAPHRRIPAGAMIELPPADVLHGDFVDLEPLAEHHLDELSAALHHREVFEGGWGGGPAGWLEDADDFRAWLATYLTGERVFVVRLASGPDAGTVVGTSTLAEFEPAKERTHLGWTAYDPRVWGSAVNPETKLLLLGHAFDHGWNRVKIQADNLNERSIGAIARLGAVREGTTRRDARRADGTWRDAVVFSVIVDDWPRVRAGLERRVATARPPRLR